MADQDNGKTLSTKIVDETTKKIIEESMKLISYLRVVGKSDADLIAAFRKVEAAAASTKIPDEDIHGLEDKLNNARKGLTTEVWVSVKKGWLPGTHTWSERVASSAILGIVLLLALATGKLTYIHNSAVAIASDLEALSSQSTATNYSRLQREMVQAWYQADKSLSEFKSRSGASFDGRCDAGTETEKETCKKDLKIPRADVSPIETLALPAQFDLARNVYFNNEAEIAILSAKLRVASEGVIYINSLLPRARLHRPPVKDSDGDNADSKGSKDALNESKKTTPNISLDKPEVVTGLCQVAMLFVPWDTSSYCPDLLTSTSMKSSVPNNSVNSINACYDSNLNRPMPSDSSDTKQTPYATSIGKEPTNFSDYLRQIFWLKNYLVCRDLITQDIGIAATQANLTQLKASLTPLAVLILPALYGAMGGAMYFLRSRLDSYLPNPNWSNAIFRIVFGAVIGVVVVWFATPNSVIEHQLSSLGLSLLGLVFMLGYAQDRLFNFLETLAPSFPAKKPEAETTSKPTS